ncbi:MobA/MobL family protein [Xanthobacter sp. KR7-65]|uniref:MobA/MobL family protein n=1 Tax=Xanthobacter sp. KR7-65 TaxID=3156612 RepID=UPI0032B3C592
MPVAPASVIDWLCQAEDTSRANARIIDKVTLALPRELNAAQRVQLVRSFAEDVTMGKAPWLAAYHDKGKDESNPHCHLIIRDRDPETGKRVMGMSEHGSTQRLRLAWERHANAALELAGRQERIDHRTLKAQGIDRAPTIHEGPKARAMEGRGARPVSRERAARNMPKCRTRTRRINYPQIDGSRSRPGYNRRVREGVGDYWAAIDADQQGRELEVLRGIHRPEPLMEGGRIILIQPPQKQGIGAGSHLLPISDTLSVPSGSFSVNFRPTVFQPTSNGVAGRKAQDEAADGFARSIQPAVNPLYHVVEIGQSLSFDKEKSMSIEDDILRRHRFELVNAQVNADKAKSNYDQLMKRSFLNPEEAERKMNNFSKHNSDDKFYNLLRNNERKNEFGRRPGSLMSKDFFKSGASERRKDSWLARRDLPDAVRDHREAQKRLNIAKAAYDTSLDRQRTAAAAPSTERAPHVAPEPAGPAQSPSIRPPEPHRAPHVVAQPLPQKAPSATPPTPQAQRAPHMATQPNRAPGIQATPAAPAPITSGSAPTPAVTPQQMAAKTVVPKKDKEFQP